MCQNKPKTWGDVFGQDGANSSRFVVDPYPSPPAPVRGRTQNMLTIQNDGQTLFHSDVPFSLPVRYGGRQLTLSPTTLPADISQFPLSSLESVMKQREELWKIGIPLG